VGPHYFVVIFELLMNYNEMLDLSKKTSLSYIYRGGFFFGVFSESKKKEVYCFFATPDGKGFYLYQSTEKYYIFYYPCNTIII
tara:strand:+ start:174 stop:422 length:249 start_codon:yes stop_codon:yes gene_type:complete